MIVGTIKEGSRRFNTCVCDDCGSNFKRRVELKNKERCKSCTDKISGKKRSTHGFNNKNSRLHVTWNNMKSRCLNKKNARYEQYGGRGITICDEWLDFSGFMDWALSNGYKENLTIDRVDVDGNYEPENCRFTDVNTQNSNRTLSSKNKTGYIGVSFYKGAFVASVQWKKKQHHVGRFGSAIDAAKARDKFIKENGMPHRSSFPSKVEIENKP
ncbi:hypothetical protein NVP1214O_39 [Vibrio phage 1.214.O._10N.222.54.F11]|nr:hypothetical protein NVP1013O_38 [Vibrio phage 1.013.O._10N.286.54.F9]AUR95888.1 hypothetical protein NVP1214O_39 [Vibrio phage 1.214.O._10N.222.54.F11]